MIVGFTGTRAGMTGPQALAVRRLVTGAIEAHHGDCVGADEQFDALCHEEAVRVVIHPPLDRRHRAFCEGAYHVNTPLGYLARNVEIVRRTGSLIAAPREETEPPVRRGQGTWSTVRFARGMNRPVHIVWPDGTVTAE